MDALKISTRIFLYDSLRFYTANIATMRALHVSIALVILLLCMFSFWIDGPPYEIAVLPGLFIEAFLIACGALFVGVAYHLFEMTILVPELGSAPGQHDYEINKDGFYDCFEGKITLFPWRQIQEVKALAGFLALRTTNHAYHFIPGRSFPNEEEFGKFLDLSRKYRDRGGLTKSRQPIDPIQTV